MLIHDAYLQLSMSPKEYIEQIDTYEYSTREQFINKLPKVVISRCPLCDALYTGPIDMHTLWDWRYVLDSPPLPRDPHFYTEGKFESVGCDHFFTVQPFLNMNQRIPSEMDEFVNGFHVPFVSDWMVPDNRSVIAVIHSMAVCRLEKSDGTAFDFYTAEFENLPQTLDGMEERSYRELHPIDMDMLHPHLADAKFVPRYTAYAITYWGEKTDRDAIYNAKMQPQIANMDREDSPFDLIWLSAMPVKKSDPQYDLRTWVERGKLQWLDITDDGLPLKSGTVEEFPYADIPFDQDTAGRVWY